MSAISHLSLPPFTVLGHRLDGRPIYNIAGGSAPAGEATTPPAAAPPVPPTPATPPAATPPAATPPAPAAPPAAAPPAGAPPASQKVEDLPDWAQKLITDARADAGKARTTAKEQAAQEARDELLKKLGLKTDGQPDVTPEQLAEQLASRETQLYNLRVETALAKSAKAHGADEDLVTAVLAHSGQLDDLDPDADDFTSKLDALVRAAVEGNPKLKAAQAAGVSGGQFTGGTGERTGRPSSLGAAIKASLNA